jgi:Flp pilus assembly protein TadG
MGWISKLRNRDQGAQLVEFALLAPLLILLLLGIVEFGWGMAQQIDVRHKARETLRQAVVDAPAADIAAQACADDMVKGSDVTEILLTTGVTPGSAATATVTANVRQITGLFGVFWGPNPTISSTVEGRVEQESTTFMNNDDLVPCP